MKTLSIQRIGVLALLATLSALEGRAPAGVPGPSELREAQKVVEAVRGRSFRRPVAAEEIDAEKLRRQLEEKLAEGLPVGLEDYFRSLSVLGAIDPADLPNLQRRLVDFYHGQVLAFYDPAARKFFVSSTAQSRMAGFSGTEESLLLTHELTHALQDQYLSLEIRMEALKTQSDSALALQAMLEGEATEVMIESAARDLPGAEEAIEAALAPLLTSTLADLDPESKNVPAFFREQLFFPYSEGTAYIRAKKKNGGWNSVNRLWDSPPTSTSEILHPDEAPRPRGRVLSDSAAAPPPGGILLYSDTLGEWTLRFLLHRAAVADADKLAAAWRADRLLFFKHGEEFSYVGKIELADESAARRLGDAWKKLTGSAQAITRGRDLIVYSGFSKAPI